MAAIQVSNITSIYNEYLTPLYSYALHLGFDEQTAMDAIHDVFYKLCLSHSSLDKISNLKAYLFSSLRNRLTDILRNHKEKTYDLVSIEERQDQETHSFQLTVTIEDEWIEKEDAEEIREKVESVLDRLTDRQREVIFLRYIQEYSYEEVAAIMQISVEACRNLQSKAVTRLRESSLPIFLLILLIR